MSTLARRSRRYGLLVCIVLGFVFLFGGSAAARIEGVAQGASSGPGEFQPGDVFLGSTSAGTIQRYSGSGTLLATLATGFSGYITGMCFDAAANLYSTDFSANRVTKFNRLGVVVQSSFGGTFPFPESCAVARSGVVYVGSAEANNLRKLDPNGVVLANFAPAVEDRGIDWIDLASDQCTMYYTSEGAIIFRFNVCTNTQLPAFVTGLARPCFALRIRANGEVIVACRPQVVRLSSSGVVLQTYSASSLGMSQPFSLDLDPDGTSFWVGDIDTGVVAKVDIATGSQLRRFTNPQGVSGLRVFATQQPAMPTQQTLGGGSGGIAVDPTRLGGDPVNTQRAAFSRA